MPFLGAQTDMLMDLARACRDRGTHLGELGEALQSTVGAVTWTGPDAEDFRGQWELCRSQLVLTADHLGSAAELLAQQAAEQDAASDPNGRIDASDYEGLVGGEFIDWSDIINAGERFGDPFRDRVEAGDADSPLGQRYTDAHPDWDPTTVPLDEAAISAAQVQQGSLGDCWYLAALMAVQQTDPGLLADNIQGLGDPPGKDGWEVQLFIDGEWQGSVVRPEDLGTKGTKSAGDDYHDGSIGFASIYEQAMINAVDGRPSRVSADTPQAGLEMITGQPARESDTIGQPSFDQYRQAIDEGRPITVMTDPIDPMGPSSDDLVGAHVYQVSGYEEATGELILTNPHGPHSSNPYEVRVDPDDPRYSFDIFMTGIGE